MNQSNGLNRLRYGLYAPVYDQLAVPWERGRRRAIERLDLDGDEEVLILGCGTGNDIAYLPEGCSVTAIDITPSMVRRTADRAEALGLDVDARVADAGELPFEADRFDVVLLHLILSVVPSPAAVMLETDRVLTGDGQVSIFDKFVPEDTTPSILRRLANPIARVLFADLTRPLEPLLEETDLTLGPRESFLAGVYTVTVARPVD